MRVKTVLKEMDEVAILYKFLYSDENNKIKFSNGLAELEVTMDKDLNFMCRNMNFPDMKAINHNSVMDLAYCAAVIKKLKETPPLDLKTDDIKNQWDEIRFRTAAMETLSGV